MKILYLTNIPSPYRVDFFNELGKKVDLTVLFENKEAIDRNNSWYGKNFSHFNAIFLQSKIKFKFNVNMNVFSYLKQDFDIIIVGQYSSLTALLSILYMKLKKIPFILNADGAIIKNENFLKYFLKKTIISSADLWIGTGKFTDKYFVHYGADKNKIFNYKFSSLFKSEISDKVIPIERKFELRHELNIKGKNVVLAVGRYIELKNYSELIRQWKDIDKNTVLYLIGEGPLKDKYLSIVKKNNISNVKILSFMNKTDLKKYYLASDLFVHPTKSEVWGLVINEATAKGLPVLVSDMCGAGEELVSNGDNGFILPYDQIPEFISKTKEYFSLSGKAKYEMKIKSLEMSKSHTIETMAESHMQIFKLYLNNNKNKEWVN